MRIPISPILAVVAVSFALQGTTLRAQDRVFRFDMGTTDAWGNGSRTIGRAQQQRHGDHQVGHFRRK
jgi:hypothetical protein